MLEAVFSVLSVPTFYNDRLSKDRPILSSERAPHRIKTETVEQ
jgi:hypothetical protein